MDCYNFLKHKRRIKNAPRSPLLSEMANEASVLYKMGSIRTMRSFGLALAVQPQVGLKIQ